MKKKSTPVPSRYALNKLKEVTLKTIMATILHSTLIFSTSANADCVKNQYGSVVCGEGQCEIDQFGKILCADPGGGAIRDQYAKVQCGVGYCAKDDLGQVWCSKIPGGGAAVDSHGKVKCLGGCNPGNSNLCQEAR